MNPAPITVLHLVGGTDPRGGVMSYVRGLLTIPDGLIEHRIWKHRSYAPENSKFVCRGAAKLIDLSIPRDIGSAILDLPPLCAWGRSQRNLVLHAHSRMGFILAALARRLVGAPVVVHTHALANNPALYHKLWRLTQAKVIFNSRKTCRHFGCEPDHSLVLMPTIPWPQPPQNAAAPRCRFIACSSFFGWKNVHVIVEGFKRVAASKPGAELHVYGLSPEPLEPAYQERVVRMAKEIPSVTLWNWDTRWLDQIQEHDIFVHAAVTEPFGIVLLEAFGKGCRMVVPRGTFLDDLSEPHSAEGIFRMASASPDDCAAQMKQAAEPNHVDLWKARRPVAQLFSIERSATELASLYRALR